MPSDGRHVLILGAGFGGISAALQLRKRLGPEHRISLIDRRSSFFMGLRKQWIMTGTGTRSEGERELQLLSRHGIEVRRADIESIDIAGKTVRTENEELTYDKLIVALGAEPRVDLCPGFSPAAFNLYDVDEVERLQRALAGFRRGKILVCIFGLPFKCPPAPYEAAMLLHDFFQQKDLRSEVEISVVTPQPISLPAAGKAASIALEAMLAERQIAFSPARQPVRLEGTRVVFESEFLDSDLLVVVPPHRPPLVVRDSGLADAGDWIAVEPASLRTKHRDVWAVGDVTHIVMHNGLPLPKAGIFAEAQGIAAAADIVADISGGTRAAGFDGSGYCFVETGARRAAAVRGKFLAAPEPEVEFGSPSEEGLRSKIAFEHERLDAWFGGRTLASKS